MRARQPERRLSETFDITYGNYQWPITVSRFADGSVAEVFVRAYYGSGGGAESEARDAAILLSLALQHGVPLEQIKHSLTREQSGRPCGILGVVVDKLLEGSDVVQSVG